VTNSFECILYCGCFLIRECVYVGFVMCVLVTCVPVFTVFCIVYTVSFVLLSLCIFILICCVCTSVRTAATE
jgi:hypothetical protein